MDITLMDIVSPYGEPIVQTEIPAEVWAAMKLEADEREEWIRITLALGPGNAVTERDREQLLEVQKFLLENGWDKFDYHEHQKAYYKRYIDAGGIAIVGPETLADDDLIHARDIILVMTSRYPELRERLLSKHGTFYMVLVPYWDDMLDIPEKQFTWAYTRFRMGKTKDERISIPAACNTGRGPGSTSVFGFCFAPAYLNPFNGEHMIRPGYTFTHEFAHALDYEMERLKPGHMDKLKEISAKYDSIGWKEFWANYVVEIWFYSVGPHSSRFKTYEDFLEKHPYPEAAKMADEWFPRISLNVTR